MKRGVLQFQPLGLGESGLIDSANPAKQKHNSTSTTHKITPFLYSKDGGNMQNQNRDIIKLKTGAGAEVEKWREG
jgi:hypothetical protein